MTELTGKVRRTVLLGAAVAIGSIGLASPASAQTGGTGYQVTQVQGTSQVRGTASATLPRTGTDTQALMTGAGLLLLAGGAAVRLGRTRAAKV
jgi:LPXTG-motif cell wall-anchored protein